MKVKQIIVVAAVAILGGFTALSINSFFEKKEVVKTKIIEQVPIYKTANSGDGVAKVDFTYAAKRSLDAVVHVKVEMTGRTRAQGYYGLMYGNPYQDYKMQASGSGVIISSDGYIVTNNHVIKDADKIDVILNDKRSYTAKLIGRDPATDIALLKITAKDLPTISYGDSEKIKVGEWVLAVGNPFNLTSTVTAGIVSAKGRSLKMLQENNSIESFIQTDAAVNPGNSGGALVNLAGELVGINTAIASKTGSYTGYSFAVPVSIVKKVVADLKEFGKVQRALLGVSIRDMDANLAEKLGIDKPEGVYIAGINKGGAAEVAGIETGDIILKVNDVAVNKVSELQEQIGKHRPGDKVKITVNRDGSNEEFEVTLRNSLGTTEFVNKEVVDVLGASFEKVSKKELRRLRISNGVKVVELGAGKLLSSGIQEGFIIVTINRQRVNSADDVRKIIKNSKRAIYVEGIYPDGSTAYYAFGLR